MSLKVNFWSRRTKRTARLEGSFAREKRPKSFAPRRRLSAAVVAGAVTLFALPPSAGAWWIFSDSDRAASEAQATPFQKANEAPNSPAAPALSHAAGSAKAPERGAPSGLNAAASRRAALSAQPPSGLASEQAAAHRQIRGLSALSESGWPEWRSANWSSVAQDAPNALGLSAQQIQRWSQARQISRDADLSARDRQEAYQEQMRESAQKGFAGLDPTQMARVRRQLFEQREQGEQAAENAWIDFYATLDPAQQNKFATLARDRIRRWDERAKMARRWDEDAHASSPQQRQDARNPQAKSDRGAPARGAKQAYKPAQQSALASASTSVAAPATAKPAPKSP